MSERVIRKHLVRLNVMNPLEMMAGARLLHVETWGDEVYLWALEDFDGTPVRRSIFVIREGLSFTTDKLPKLKHVGSFRRPGCDGVRHLFDCGEFPLSSTPRVCIADRLSDDEH